MFPVILRFSACPAAPMIFLFLNRLLCKLCLINVCTHKRTQQPRRSLYLLFPLLCLQIDNVVREACISPTPNPSSFNAMRNDRQGSGTIWYQNSVNRMYFRNCFPYSLQHCFNTDSFEVKQTLIHIRLCSHISLTYMQPLDLTMRVKA